MNDLRITVRDGVVSALGPLEWRVLADLWSHGESSFPAMAARLGVAPTTASTMIYKLRRRDLVRRTPGRRYVPTMSRADFDRAVVATVLAALDTCYPDAVAGLLAGRAG